MPASIFPPTTSRPVQTASELIQLSNEALQDTIRRTGALLPDDLAHYNEAELRTIGEGFPGLDTFQENALYKAAAMLRAADAALDRKDAEAATYATTSATYFIGTANSPPSPSLSEHQAHVAHTGAENRKNREAAVVHEWLRSQPDKCFATLGQALDKAVQAYMASRGGDEGTLLRRFGDAVREPGDPRGLRSAFARVCRRALRALKQVPA